MYNELEVILLLFVVHASYYIRETMLMTMVDNKGMVKERWEALFDGEPCAPRAAVSA
jgi:hypothetical protein